jgi:hypothetical protein
LKEENMADPEPHIVPEPSPSVQRDNNDVEVLGIASMEMIITLGTDMPSQQLIINTMIGD